MGKHSAAEIESGILDNADASFWREHIPATGAFTRLMRRLTDLYNQLPTREPEIHTAMSDAYGDGFGVYYAYEAKGAGIDALHPALDVWGDDADTLLAEVLDAFDDEVFDNALRVEIAGRVFVVALLHRVKTDITPMREQLREHLVNDMTAWFEHGCMACRKAYVPSDPSFGHRTLDQETGRWVSRENKSQDWKTWCPECQAAFQGVGVNAVTRNGKGERIQPKPAKSKASKTTVSTPVVTASKTDAQEASVSKNLDKTIAAEPAKVRAMLALSDNDLGALVREQLQARLTAQVKPRSEAVTAERKVAEKVDKTAKRAERALIAKIDLPAINVQGIEIPALSGDEIASLSEMPDGKRRSPYNKALSRLGLDTLTADDTTWHVLVATHENLLAKPKKAKKAKKAKAAKAKPVEAKVEAVVVDTAKPAVSKQARKAAKVLMQVDPSLTKAEATERAVAALSI